MHELLRTRWAAVGAAVAVTLGAGGLSMAQAAITDGEKPVYVALAAPCRLVDTRPDSNVGPKSTVLAAGESNAYTIQVTGENGNCRNALAIPLDATAVALNVTAIARTAPVTGRSYFTVYPADAPRPVTSNLNFLADQPPVPNKVDVGLSDDGQIRHLQLRGHRRRGRRHLRLLRRSRPHRGRHRRRLADGCRPRRRHDHGGRHRAGLLAGDDLADGTVTRAQIADEPGIVSAYRSDPFAATVDPTAVVSTSIRVPADGTLEVHVSGNWEGDGGVNIAQCQIQKGSSVAIDVALPNIRLHDHNAGTDGLTSFSAHRAIPVAVADNPGSPTLGQVISLVCVETDGEVSLDDVHISATYYPTSYAPAP